MTDERRRRLRAALALAGFVLVPLLALRLPAVRGAIVRLISFVSEGGALGLLAYVGAYVASALVVAPIWVFSAMAGYVFGAVRGFGLALGTVTLASMTAFAVARSASLLLGRRERTDPLFAAVERAIASDGLRIALLLRIAPVMPQNLLTYVLATATRLPARSFFPATLLGLVPATLLHVYAGSLVRSAQALVEGGAAPPAGVQLAAVALGLVAIVGAFVFIGRAARRELSRVIDAGAASTSADVRP